MSRKARAMKRKEKYGKSADRSGIGNVPLGYSLEKRSISEGIELSGIAPYRNSPEMKRHAVALPRIAME